MIVGVFLASGLLGGGMGWLLERAEIDLPFGILGLVLGLLVGVLTETGLRAFHPIRGQSVRYLTSTLTCGLLGLALFGALWGSGLSFTYTHLGLLLAFTWTLPLSYSYGLCSFAIPNEPQGVPLSFRGILEGAGMYAALTIPAFILAWDSDNYLEIISIPCALYCLIHAAGGMEVARASRKAQTRPYRDLDEARRLVDEGRLEEAGLALDRAADVDPNAYYWDKSQSRTYSWLQKLVKPLLLLFLIIPSGALVYMFSPSRQMPESTYEQMMSLQRSYLDRMSARVADPECSKESVEKLRKRVQSLVQSKGKEGVKLANQIKVKPTKSIPRPATDSSGMSQEQRKKFKELDQKIRMVEVQLPQWESNYVQKTRLLELERALKALK